ncbi:MAG: DnaD domain protein [Oscillospiraceae bacterium]|nr:DnaD domain protein [Oscillospiraceae bacterium]
MSTEVFDNSIADRLIAAHDGDVALLYIWLCRNGGFNADNAARELCRTSSEIEAAYEKLARLGLAGASRRGSEVIPEPEEKLPEYTAQDILRRSSSDEGFKAVIEEAQQVFGRMLSTADMKTLFGIYDHLGFSPEVLCLLLNYCRELFAEKYGAGRLPTMRSIEKEAYAWANREILTAQQAEEYIADASRRRSAAERIKDALGIRGRVLSATESRYVSSWLDMGFDERAAAIAYDRTVTHTGALKWNYMNKIMQSWHGKGLHTPEEINEKDGRREAELPEGDRASNLDYLRSVYEKVKNQVKDDEHGA